MVGSIRSFVKSKQTGSLNLASFKKNISDSRSSVQPSKDDLQKNENSFSDSIVGALDSNYSGVSITLPSSEKKSISKILNTLGWSASGASGVHSSGSNGGFVGGSSASVPDLNTYSLTDSNSNLNPLEITNSEQPNNKDDINGAGIKLPASATNLDPSSITNKTDPMVPNPNNVPLSEVEFQVVLLTNLAREQKGLPPLEVKSNLIETARESSFKMQAINSMVHGLTSGWGRENIAMGQRSAEDVVRAWLNSPGHYANIMSNSRFIGVGDTSATGRGNFWTMQLS